MVGLSCNGVDNDLLVCSVIAPPITCRESGGAATSIGSAQSNCAPARCSVPLFVVVSGCEFIDVPIGATAVGAFTLDEVLLTESSSLVHEVAISSAATETAQRHASDIGSACQTWTR